MAAVGEHAISYDARGLSEPDAAVPEVSEIDGTSAEFDAHDLLDAADQPRAALADQRAGRHRRDRAQPGREALRSASAS